MVTMLKVVLTVPCRKVVFSSLLMVKPMMRCTIECFTALVSTHSNRSSQQILLWQSFCFWKGTMLVQGLGFLDCGVFSAGVWFFWMSLMLPRLVSIC